MDKILKCNVIKLEEDKEYICEESIVCEYPLTIFLNKEKLATLLCSPENLKELVIGFFRTEELIKDLNEIEKINIDESMGIAQVETKGHLKINKFQCKKLEIQDNNMSYEDNVKEFLESMSCNAISTKVKIQKKKIYEFMNKNLNHSSTFKNTGGVHTIALCDEDDVLVICEDVARHNAMDKVIGSSIIKSINLKDKIMILSGRVSLEMILKAARLEIPIIISKSAPTSLSLGLAKKLNITLVGFVRGNRMNIYANGDRIIENN
ncbi:formate dehydrogenase accessory sulfurtransferase FdhD [Clostridium frigidicarnis]|uniref:Sulfur carrier protein FdhD n=1 Tax=Clostridium frigidicarnis TaxID=84698 RepID=A0A1I0WDG6_9CLOT|nr:formate dehydrogenase accessory sulfurtransferase FdhD [Clostridium frigidicarnis]SFA86789.1 FdhD protein [Clostridium frigidicarnis]